MSIQKLSHKLLNSDNKNRHFLATMITHNRNNRMLSENKCGPQRKIERNDKYSNKTFSFKIINIYNRINRQLTLLKNHQKIKKCINKLTTNPNIKFNIPKQNDYNGNEVEKHQDEFLFQCYT